MIYNIVQDDDGFLWIATWNGLEKFDGYSFRNFKTHPTDSLRLLYNRLPSISTGPENGLWCQTYDMQIYVFDTHEERFIDPFSFHPTVRRCEEFSWCFNLPGGVIWLLGRDGSLWRLDGKRYREQGAVRYFPATRAERGENVFGIYPDGAGGEWILTNHGYWVYGKDEIHGLREFRRATTLQGGLLLADADGQLAIYDAATGRISDISTDSRKVNTKSIMHTLSDGRVVLVSERKISLFNPADRTIGEIDLDFSGEIMTCREQHHPDGGKTLWALTDRSDVLRIDLTSASGRNMTKPYNAGAASLGMSFIHCDKHNDIWIYPPDGHMCLYNEATGELERAYCHTERGNEPVPDFTSYIVDTQGNMWGAHTHGIQLMTFPLSHNSILNDDGIECRGMMIDSSNRLWTSFKNSMIKIYDSNYDYLGNLTQQGRIVNDRNARFGATMYDIKEDSKGRIWLGSRSHGLYLATPLPGGSAYSIRHFTPAKDDPNSISSEAIFNICEDSKGRIWIGTYGGGLNLVEEDMDGRISFRNYANSGLPTYPGRSCSKVRFITCTSRGIMMIATTDGLLTFDGNFDSPSDIRFYHNRCDIHRDSTLSGSDVAHIFEDSRHDVYLAILSGGICRLCSSDLLSEHLTFSYINRRNGLPSDMVYSINEDSRGQLWLAIDDAICRYDSGTGDIETFGRYDFHRTLPVGEVPFVIDSAGIASFGLANSVMQVDLMALSKNDYAPNLVFREAKIYTEGHGEENITIYDKDLLSLAPHQRNLSISFVALDYMNSANISYAYRLRGFNDHWIDNGHNRTASFYALPAGDYVLEVKSTNCEGVWNDRIFSLPIHIEPTFIETVWAKILYVIAFLMIALTVWYVSVYIFRLQRRIDIEQELTSMKLKFFTDVSHELRTPLTLIVNPIDEVIGDRSLSTRSREYMAMAKSNTDRMLRLINQFLDIRKIQNSKMKVYLEQTDAIGLLRKICHDFKGLAEQKRINFSFDCDIPRLVIYTDVDKLEKIVFNLLSNAFKYTPDGMSVTLSAHAEGNMLHVTVIDEGSGMEEWQMASLFKRFETLGRKKHVPSSGIGLSLVKELTDILHGHISVSGAKGVGSRFEVSIPGDYATFSHDTNAELILKDSDTMTASHDAEASDAPDIPGGERLTVLVVEDNSELRRMLVSMLNGLYNVVEACDGKDALDKLAPSNPDIIISDIMMPNVDGLELLAAVRENREWSHIPFVLLTAKSSVSERIEGLEYGADDYITKPFNASYLKARLRSIIGQRSRLFEYFMSRISDKTGPEETASAPTGSLPSLSGYDSEFVDRLSAFIEREYHRPDLTIDEMTSAMNLGRTVFNRKVKSLFHSTPIELLTTVRLRKACGFLSDSAGMTVSEITYRCGFSSPQYFNRVFKSRYGSTPLEWRKNRNNT